MDMNVTVTLSPSASTQVQESLARIRQLEQERVALIARMNRPHLVAARWLKMRLIWLFN
jgi:hypothetical protein